MPQHTLCLDYKVHASILKNEINSLTVESSKFPNLKVDDILFVKSEWAYALDFGYWRDDYFLRATYTNAGPYDDVKKDDWKAAEKMPEEFVNSFPNLFFFRIIDFKPATEDNYIELTFVEVDK